MNILFLHLLALLSFINTSLASVSCTFSTISSILPSGATLNFAYLVPQNGSFGSAGQPPGNLEFPTNATQLPALCAVSVNVKVTNTTTAYNFGIFLPDNWNQRFATGGNGGYGGGINWPDMGIFSQYGFAAMATDTGHNASAFNASWALNNPDAITNWAYRAMHGSVVLAKQIVESYYDASKIQYSYYSSCSTGGRQGLKEVQMFPEDFDGVIAGAPAWWISHLASDSIWIAIPNLPNSSPNHIPESLFPVITAEILRQCDAQDGVQDGLILNPFTCSFYPEALLCNTQQPTTNQSTSCLTPAQLSTLYHIYNDWVDVNQTFVFPGLALGADPTALVGTDSTDSPSPIGLTWIQNAVLSDPTWPWQNMSYAIVQTAQTKNPGHTDADDFDLTPFRQRGGKLLSYHGLADPLIPTGSSLYLHSQILQTMSAPNVTSTPLSDNLEDFFRFFLVPGMGHCGGSAPPFDSAPWYVAQAGGTPAGATHSVPGFQDAQHDILLALMDWVERGQAPEQLVATKFFNDTVGQGVQRQIPLCVFPRRVVYTGGDPDRPESFECVGVA